MTTRLKIMGMSCGHCVGAVKEALEAVPGVMQATVDLAAATAVVEHGPTTEVDVLTRAVEEEGYEAEAA